MIRNMGAVDRVLRVFVVAPVAIVLAFLVGAGTIAGVVLFVIAGIMLASGTTGFCPTYILLGISTHSRGLHRVGHGIRHGHA
jgi:Inner membrane protein YgaP-like, transmembrane domain